LATTKADRQLHLKYKFANVLSKDVIGASIEVHRLKNLRLLEPIYEKCPKRELKRIKNLTASFN
jgi:hypothetical protein